MLHTPSRTAMLAALMTLASAAGGCGGSSEYLLIGSAHAPGADGIVEVEEVGEGRNLVTIHMERLQPPRHLGDDFQSYLVWFEGEDGTTIKAGSLAYNSETRTGDIMKTCPLEKFTLKITAERAPDTDTPEGLTIAERVLPSD